jgi:CheY-specific phosphatase CheX
MENTRKIEQILTKAIFEVFEKMFFVFAEPLRETGAAHYRVRANIRFSGPMEGAMQISMNPGLAKLMAANMLNLQDDELTEPVIADCVKESINMICGNFVRKVDPERVVQLSIPVFELISDRSGDMSAQSDSSLKLVFNTEGGAFEVMMTASG